jgi:hypothetical protein
VISRSSFGKPLGPTVAVLLVLGAVFALTIGGRFGLTVPRIGALLLASALVVLYFTKPNATFVLLLLAFSVYWVPLSAGRIGLLKPLAALFFVCAVFETALTRRRVDRLFLYACLFVIAWIVSAIVNQRSIVTVYNFSNVALWSVVAPFVVTSLLNRGLSLRFMAFCLIVAAAIEGILGFLQVFGGEEFYFQKYLLVEGGARAYDIPGMLGYRCPFGTFGSRHQYGMFIVQGYIVGLSLLISGATRSRHLLPLIVFLAVCTIISMSRASIVCLFIGSLLLLYIRKKRIGSLLNRRTLVIAMSLGVALVIAFLVPSILETLRIRFLPRYYGGWLGFLEQRESLTLASLQAFSEHPVFGVGPLQFSPQSYYWMARANSPVLLSGREAHNAFSEVAGELGSFGLTFLILMLARTYRRLSAAHEGRIWAGPDDTRAIASAMLTMFLLQLLVHFIGNSFYGEIGYFWLCSAVAANVAQSDRSLRLPTAGCQSEG